jgi:predicted enzyme related to lactoylglutathione lyase
MLTIGSTVLGVDNVNRAMAFWRAALGYVPRDEPEETWVVLAPPNGGAGPRLSLMLSETPSQHRPRVHLDLYADNQAAEIERLIGLGATPADWDYPDDADFVVLADPAGNRFCVIDKSSG